MRYQWPYEPYSVFWFFFLEAALFQTVFKRYEWRIKRLLPTLAIANCVLGIIAALLTDRLPGVLWFSDLYVFLTVAMPGVGGGLGAIVGQFIGWLWRFLS